MKKDGKKKKKTPERYNPVFSSLKWRKLKYIYICFVLRNE